MRLSNIEDIGQQLDEFLWSAQDEKQRLKRERILLAAFEDATKDERQKTELSPSSLVEPLSPRVQSEKADKRYV